MPKNMRPGGKAPKLNQAIPTVYIQGLMGALGLRPPYQKQPGQGWWRAQKRQVDRVKANHAKFGPANPVVGFGERQRSRAETRLAIKDLGRQLQASERRSKAKTVGIPFEIYRSNRVEKANALANG